MDLTHQNTAYIMVWTKTIKGRDPLQIIGVFPLREYANAFLGAHFTPDEILNEISIFTAPYYVRR